METFSRVSRYLNLNYSISQNFLTNVSLLWKMKYGISLQGHLIPENFMHVQMKMNKNIKLGYQRQIK